MSNAKKAGMALVAVAAAGSLGYLVYKVATAKGAAFTLSVKISPMSGTLNVNQTLTFVPIISGGSAPYSYKWYLNSKLSSTTSTYRFTPTAGGSYALYVVVTDSAGRQAASADASITVIGPGAPPPQGGGIPVAIQLFSYQTSLTQLIGWWLQGINPLQASLQADPVTSFSYPPVSKGFISAIAEFKVVDGNGVGVPGVQVQIGANASTDDQGGELLIDGVMVAAAQPKISDSDGKVWWYLTYRIDSYSVLCGLHQFGCGLFIVFPVKSICVGDICGINEPPGYVTKGPVYTQSRVYVITATMLGTTLQNSFAISCRAESEALW
jgi:hypothetical protein